MNRHNIFVLELMGIARLASKALDRGLRIHDTIFEREDLERYLTHFEGIAGTVDHTHTTHAYERLNAVTTRYQGFRQQALAEWIGAL
jgi:hypothetical protein